MSVPTAGDRYGVASRRRSIGAVFLAIAAFVAVAALLSSGLGLVDLARWAAAQQRAFHAMVSELLSLREGSPLALAALMGACLAYGFVHAAVPGHGKFLIAGAGLASDWSALRLIALSLAGSAAQAVTAIVLVYGSFALLDITAGWAMTATNEILIPLSTLAIAAIGVVLARRGLLGLRRRGHAHCNHRHGPTAQEAARVRGVRDAIALIAGIGLRPCTGSIFVLVAAWRLDLLAVGAAAAFVMAAGTGALTSLVAISATTARGATLFAAGVSRAPVAVPLMQLVAGGAIVLASAVMLVAPYIAA